jgi:hypothetical protein
VVLTVADDMGGLLVSVRTQLEDGQLGTVPVRLDMSSMSSTVSTRSWPDQNTGVVMAPIVPSLGHIRHQARGH